MTARVILYSGGILSWAAAMRTIERHGSDDVTLLFTDTSMEDADLYRFIDETARRLNVPIVRLSDGRNPWQVFKDSRMIGNTRADICSRILKREMSKRWLKENAPGCTLVFGIDWEETHRFENLKRRYGAAGHPVEAPMTDSPWMTKEMVLDWVRQAGIEPPRLYALGFAHNNCGGFCVRAGQGHFINLLRQLPGVYAWHEGEEQKLREYLGKDIAILRDRTGGKTRPMTLREFRERIEAKSIDADLFDVGGCGCFVDEDSELEAA